MPRDGRNEAFMRAMARVFAESARKGLQRIEPKESDMNVETLRQTEQTWTREPEKARSKPVVRARSEGAQAVIEAGSFTWKTDLPPGLGGTNAAPSPTALLLSALAGCAIVFVRDTLAPQLGVDVESVEATVECESDARGLLGMGDADPSLRSLRLDVKIRSKDGDAGVSRIAEAWHQRCPIYLALRNASPVETRFAAV